MPNNINLDISGFYFYAKGRFYPIESGHVRTSHLENGNVSWDWQMALELKKSDVIPANEKTALCYGDKSVFVYTKVLERRKEGNLSAFKLVPYMNE